MKAKTTTPLVDAVHLMQNGRPAEAEQACRTLLAASPNDGHAWHLLGVLLGQRSAGEEAIASLERAVQLVPKEIGAWMNLGVLAMERAPDRAEQCFRRVLALDPNSIPARGNLATMYHRAERYDDADKELRAILKRSSNDAGALELLARVQRMRTNFEESTRLLRRLVRLRPDDRELRSVLSESYFLWYDSVDKQHDKAIVVLREWLEFEPEAPVARHMYAALTGRDAPNQAPAEYVQHHFDAFAEQFDGVLDRLQYRGPELLCRLLERAVPRARADLDVADVGCGTGRFGPLVAPWKRRLVGVDLSRNMLEKAKERDVYDALVQADITEYLAAHGSSFDVIACADTFIYIGDLAPLVAAAFASLRAGGRFFGTIESLDEGFAKPYRLHTAGRYAHKRSYLEETLVGAGFVLESTTEEFLRREFEASVMGFTFAAARPNA